MKEIFKQIIINFQNTSLPDLAHRTLELPKLAPNIRKVYVLIGVRRGGKTWCMYQLIKQLLTENIAAQQIVYINFADDRFSGTKLSDLSAILEAYFELYPEYTDSPNLHFFFDEIHEVENWEKFIRRLLDTEKMQIYISGSSAKMLSKEIATTLRGRSIDREIFPFDVCEFLDFYKIDYHGQLTSKQKNVINGYIERYLYQGGFPELLFLPSQLHAEILQGYMESVLYRDIIERYKIKNAHIVKQLLIYCLQNSGSLFSINKIFYRLKSGGLSISKNSLYKFMTYFEDAYCVFSVPLYNFSMQKSSLRPKKIYAVDSGLIKAYNIKPDFEKAAILETVVFLHFRRQGCEIYYYQTKSNKEIDFLILGNNGLISLYQVSLSLARDSTKEREISALNEAMQELKIDDATIITTSDSSEIANSAGTIHCISLTQFLLNK